MQEKIKTTIKELADNSTKSMIHLSASLVAVSGYNENAIIQFVNMITDQCSEKEGNNKATMEKWIGKENLKVIFEYANQKSVQQDYIVMNKCMEEDMPKQSLKCPHCNSTSFTITEQLVWNGEVDEDERNIVNCFHKTGEIDEIICKKCEENITEVINTDNTTFNFQ